MPAAAANGGDSSQPPPMPPLCTQGSSCPSLETGNGEKWGEEWILQRAGALLPGCCLGVMGVWAGSCRGSPPLPVWGRSGVRRVKCGGVTVPTWGAEVEGKASQPSHRQSGGDTRGKAWDPPSTYSSQDPAGR